MKTIAVALFVLTLCLCAGAQAPSAFPATTYNFNLSPITLPGVKASATGAETDIKLHFTANNVIGETTVMSPDYLFVGGRVDHIFPQFSKWFNNVSPGLNGYQFQFGVTGSLGVVKPFGVVPQSHWGERAGIFLNYALSGSTGLGLEVQWNNYPGYARNVPSLAFGPNFHF